MADTRMFPVPPKFNMDYLIQKITQMYQAKGFTVMAMPMGTGASIDFRKNDGGFHKYIGLALGIRATIMVQGDSIIINFSDDEWTGKIVGLALGWVLCFIPFVTAIIGIVRQLELPKSIGNDIQLIVSEYEMRSRSTVIEYCPECGTKISDPNAIACSNCGKTLETIFK